MGITTGLTTLDAYNNTSAITGNAVDIFIYDTSKDSDGGAWRKRTQDTSWYNEASSSTRSSRKEFPAVAVIVAEQGDVTIYDGDDPDLPMWMVFQSGGGGGWNAKIIATATATSSVSAVNGMLAIGTTPSSQGVIVVNFLEDMTKAYLSTSYYGGIDTAPLSLRNTTGHTFASNVSGGNTLPLIVHNNINDVAITVLPNAPIDSATGLPVPTIAVATNGGTSVIKDDGTVVSHGHSYGSLTRINIDGTNLIAHHNGPTGGRSIVVGDLVTLKRHNDGANFPAHGSANSSNTNAREYGYGSYITSAYASPFRLRSFGLTNDLSPLLNGNEISVGANSGLIKINENPTTPAAGSVAYITSKYNTGWMNGDIKLATLSDTDDTDVTGSELVTNGTFGSDTSGWTAYNAVISHDSGTIKVDDSANAGSNSNAYQQVTLEVGKTYTISVDVTATTNTAFIAISTSYISPSWYASGVGVGTYSHTFVAGSATQYIALCANGTSVANFDNISVRLAEEDRSVNGNGLQVFGTVTKSAVATGADLVAYSGFSTTNYIRQPYTGDLNAGTGDYCVMGWVKSGITSGYSDIIAYGNVGDTSYPGSEDGSWFIQLHPTYGFSLYMKATGTASSGWSTYTLGGDNFNGTNQWYFITIVRSGSDLVSYQNGKYIGTSSSSTIGNDCSSTQSSMTLRVGWQGSSYSYPADSEELALWRVSKTAPTAEQIKKIYEDEKPLFQENAKATLNGSSDAVTALAYDDSTELLHVGTSGGRSTFQGLRRIDETTNNTTEIAAQGGMIVEETA